MRANGMLRADDKMSFGHLEGSGKFYKESEKRDYRFNLGTIAIPTQSNGRGWKIIGAQPAQAGSARIYGVAGDLSLQRAVSTTPAGIDRFEISRIGNQVAGGEFRFAVTVVDSGSGRIDSDYMGTVAISTNNIASPEAKQ